MGGGDGVGVGVNGLREVWVIAWVYHRYFLPDRK